MVEYLSDAHIFHLVVGIIVTRENGKKDIVKSKKYFVQISSCCPIHTNALFTRTSEKYRSTYM